MIRSDGTSRNFQYRPDVVREGFQVRYHLVEPRAIEVRHILNHHPSGPAVGHNPTHVRPEVTRIFQAATASTTGRGEGLAGEPPGNDVDWRKMPRMDIPDIRPFGDMGPVFLEDPSAEGVVFDLPPNGESGTLEAKLKPPDP